MAQVNNLIKPIYNYIIGLQLPLAVYLSARATVFTNRIKMFQQNVLLVLQENVYCRLSGCTQLIYIIYSASLVG